MHVCDPLAASSPASPCRDRAVKGFGQLIAFKRQIYRVSLPVPVANGDRRIYVGGTPSRSRRTTKSELSREVSKRAFAIAEIPRASLSCVRAPVVGRTLLGDPFGSRDTRAQSRRPVAVRTLEQNT